jgi:hypothetical protein
MNSQPVGKTCFSALTAAACVAALIVSTIRAGAQTTKATDWQDWGGDAARTHFSPLQQITAGNVSQLPVELRALLGWPIGDEIFWRSGYKRDIIFQTPRRRQS